MTSLKELRDLEERMTALRLAQKQRADGERLLNERGVQVGECQPPALEPGGYSVARVGVKTNLFPLMLHGDCTLTRYKFDLVGSYVNKKGEEMKRFYSGMARDDVEGVENRAVCLTAINLYINKFAGTFPQRCKLFYDLRNLLLSVDKIKTDENGVFHGVLRREDCGDNWPCHGPYETLALTLTDTNSPVKLSDVTKVPEQFGYDRSPELALELIVSQYCMDNQQDHICFPGGNNYLMNPGGAGFQPHELPTIKGGCYVAVGSQKTVRLIKGTPQNPNLPALVIETKKAIFHNCENLLQKVLGSFPQVLTKPKQLKEARTLLHNLVVVSLHLPRPRVYQIKEFVDSDSYNNVVNLNGQDVTLVDYFKLKYNITLTRPDMYVFRTKDRKTGELSVHPLELYQVCDNQRVLHDNTLPDQIAELIKVCAIPPRTLEQQIYANARALGLLDSAFCRAAGVEVIPKPLIYGQQQLSQFDTERLGWRPGRRFYRCATVRSWSLYGCEADRMFTEQNLRTFAQAFVQECRNHGMTIDLPREVMVLPYHQTTATLKELFGRADVVKNDLIMFITTKEDQRIHSDMKKYERHHDVVTQDVTTKVAAAAAGIAGPPKRLTMENIVNKTNMKCGGLNYVIGNMRNKSMVGANDLYIGFSANLPGSGKGLHLATAPTVVGVSLPSFRDIFQYAANDVSDTIEFTGDYIFQEAMRDEKICVIESIVATVLQRFKDHRKKDPQRVFLYRNGCVENNFDMLLKYEIPLMRHTIAQYCPSSKLVFIVANKMHNIRLIPENITGQRPHEQNLKPGTVVDTTIVNTTFFEFYLIGHAARMGTAKIPRYAVLANDAKLCTDEIQEITYQLAYGHQIITGATGMPSPIFIANRFAERGRMNYISSLIQTGSGSDSSHIRPEDDVETVTKKISYASKKLRNVRFNA